MTSMVRTKKTCRLLMVVSALVAVAGLILFFYFSEAAGICLMIAGMAVFMICAGISNFIERFAFHYTLLHHKKEKKDRSRGTGRI